MMNMPAEPKSQGKIPGRVVGEVNATPKKRIMDALRRGDYLLEDAVAEYIDNAIDAAARRGPIPRGTRIRVDVDPEGRILTITDNGGGRSPDEISRFVTLGESDLPIPESMGMFGAAAKIAGLAVAREVVIVTRSAGTKALGVVMSEDWLKEESWTLPTFEPAESVAEGTTVVKLRDVVSFPEDADKSGELGENFRSDFGTRYAMVLKENHSNLVIEVDGKPVRSKDPADDLIDRPWAPSPYWCPSTSNKIIAGPSGKPISAMVTIGLMMRASMVQYGAYVYCNGRLVVKDDRIGFTSKFKPHAERARLRAIVNLRGPALDMPWTPRKNSLDRNNPIYRQLERILEQTYVDYFKGLRREIRGKRSTPNEIIAQHIADLLDAGTCSPSDVPSALQQIPDVRTVLEGGAPPQAEAEETEVEEPVEEFIGGYLPTALIESVRTKMERYYGQRMTKQAVLMDAFKRAETHYASKTTKDPDAE